MKGSKQTLLLRLRRVNNITQEQIQLQLPMYIRLVCGSQHYIWDGMLEKERWSQLMEFMSLFLHSSANKMQCTDSYIQLVIGTIRTPLIWQTHNTIMPIKWFAWSFYSFHAAVIKRKRYKLCRKSINRQTSCTALKKRREKDNSWSNGMAPCCCCYCHCWWFSRMYAFRSWNPEW